jgi:hypothetical protein
MAYPLSLHTPYSLRYLSSLYTLPSLSIHFSLTLTIPLLTPSFPPINLLVYSFAIKLLNSGMEISLLTVNRNSWSEYWNNSLSSVWLSIASYIITEKLPGLEGLPNSTNTLELLNNPASYKLKVRSFISSYLIPDFIILNSFVSTLITWDIFSFISWQV